MKKTKNHRTWMIAAGILTAAIISFSQLFYFQASELSKKEVASEQQKDDSHDGDSSGDQLYFSVPASTMHSSSQVESGPDFSFLLELLVSTEQPARRVVQSPVSAGKLFQTLFQVIIAPNAP